MPREVPYYLTHRYVPYQRAASGLTLACVDPCPALHDFVRAHYGTNVHFALATPRELADYLNTRGATPRTRLARLGLRRRFRHLAADRVLLPHQIRGLLLLAALLGALCYAMPLGAWQALLLAMNASLKRTPSMALVRIRTLQV